MIVFVTNQQSQLEVDTLYRYGTIDEVVEYCKTKKLLGLDTETEGFFNHQKKIIMLQIGDKDTQFVIDTRGLDISPLKEILEDPNIIKLLHNAKFDYKFLRMEGIMLNNIWDTQLAEMVLTTGLDDAKVSLAAVAEKYLGIVMNKDVRNQFIGVNGRPFTASQIEYGAKDVEYLIDIREQQLVPLKDLQLEDCLRLENKFTAVLADIEYNGFYLNQKMWRELEYDNMNKLEEAEEALNKYVIDNNHIEFIDNQLSLFSSDLKCRVSWASPKQVIEYLKFLGVNTQIKDKKTGELKDTCEEKAIGKYAKNFPFLKLYFHYKHIAKELSTYGIKFLKNINHITGRVHSDYWQIISTGRISSNNPNLQNIPAREEFRSCFRAEPGNVLIVADYGGQEQRVLADQCKDPSLLDFYENGDGDMHCLVTRKIYPELTEIDTPTIKKEHKSKRQFAKTIGFAMNYGGSEHTIADRLDIPLEEAGQLVKAYFDGFPVMTKYFKAVTAQSMKNGYILIDPITKRKSFINRFKEFKDLEKMVKAPGFWEKYRANKAQYKKTVRDYFVIKGNIERNSQNYPIQGTSGSMTKLAALFIKEELLNNNLFDIVKIVNLVHDEIVVECPKENQDIVANIVSKSMVKAGDAFCKTVPMIADAVISDYWTH